jgi:acyl carrier protein
VCPNDDVLSSIRQFVAEKFPLARKRGIQDNDSLVAGGIVDSLGILEIVTFLEESFAFTLDDDEVVADNFDTIAAIANFVIEKNKSHPVSPTEA